MTSSNDTTIPPLKCCKKCGKHLPAKLPFFYVNIRLKYGVESVCRGCRVGWHADYFQVVVLRFALAERGYRECTACNAILPLTFIHFRKQVNGLAGLRSICRECDRRDVRRRRIAEDTEHRRQKHRDYMNRNPGKCAAYARAARRRNYHNPEFRARMRTSSMKRKKRLRNLPFNFGTQDWIRCLNYWNRACAICGKTADGHRVIAADHWIPVTDKRKDNPGTVPWNIVPLCHNDGGCNNHKQNKLPEKWLLERFGTDKAAEILQRINDYFAWVKQQN